MIFQMDEVLWEFSKFYRKKFLAENPELSADMAAIAVLLALEENGDVVQNIDLDGTVTCKATPQFLDSTGLEPGPLVTLKSTLN
jgi:hypothetical protein